MRHNRDEFWRLMKNSSVCKDLNISFAEHILSVDREARALLWPQIKQVTEPISERSIWLYQREKNLCFLKFLRSVLTKELKKDSIIRDIEHFFHSKFVLIYSVLVHVLFKN